MKSLKPVLTRAAVACALTVAGGLGLASPSFASTVDLTYNLNLNGMSSGEGRSSPSCPDGVCGTVTVTGDTTSSLTFVVDLAQGVSFLGQHSKTYGSGPVLYFDLTGPNRIYFSAIGDSGTIGSKSYSYNSPIKGSFDPSSGNFPGLYNYEVTCTNNTSGKICNGPLTFTASGADATHPFVIGEPDGHGLFAGDPVAFVADLSISGRCGDFSCVAGTGLVGSTLEPRAPVDVAAVPEASTWIMMMVGFAGLGFAGYRTRKVKRFIV